MSHHTTYVLVSDGRYVARRDEFTTDLDSALICPDFETAKLFSLGKTEIVPLYLARLQEQIRRETT